MNRYYILLAGIISAFITGVHASDQPQEEKFNAPRTGKTSIIIEMKMRGNLPDAYKLVYETLDKTNREQRNILSENFKSNIKSYVAALKKLSEAKELAVAQVQTQLSEIHQIMEAFEAKSKGTSPESTEAKKTLMQLKQKYTKEFFESNIKEAAEHYDERIALIKTEIDLCTDMLDKIQTMNLFESKLTDLEAVIAQAANRSSSTDSSEESSENNCNIKQ